MARPRTRFAYNGVLLVDKPSGMTSHDVIDALRAATGVSRIGHAGTLDPLATGLLVVLVGKATRLAGPLSAQDKTYRTTFTFGAFSTTDDAQGELRTTGPLPSAVTTYELAQKVVDKLVGSHFQTPPNYSARLVDGKRAYDLSRQGVAPILEPREVTIHAAQLRAVNPEAATWELDLTVSKGTYIRSIARDIGQALGCGCHVSELRRLFYGSGPGALNVTDAHPLEELVAHEEVALSFVDPATLLPTLPRVSAEDSEVVEGRYLFTLASQPYPDGTRFAAKSADNRLLALYTYDGSNPPIDLPGATPRLLHRLVPDVVIPEGLSKSISEPSVVVLGVFDGVHRGHRALIDRARTAAHPDARVVAVTFDRPVARTLEKNRSFASILSLEEKVDALKRAGADEVRVIPFNDECAALSGERFLDDVIFGRMLPRAIVVGEDFKIGAGARMGIAELEQFCTQHACEVIVGSFENYQGARISSTRIRAALTQGNLALAHELLGDTYRFEGHVVKGEQWGRTIGVPTANIVVHKNVLIPEGIYAVRARRISLDKGSHNEFITGALFVGHPRDPQQPFTYELHLFDWEGNLYGETLEIEVGAKVAPVVSITDKNELVSHIHTMVEQVKQYENEHPLLYIRPQVVENAGRIKGAMLP